MKTRTRAIVLAAATIAVGTAGIHAIAAPPAGHGPGSGMPSMHGTGPMGGMGMHRGGMSDTFGDPARLETLKTGLGIAAAQEPAWTAYTKTLRETAASMRASHEGVDMNALHGKSEAEREAFMNGMRQRRDTAFATVKAAAETLLAALDDTQKAKAREILPGLAMPGHAMTGHGGMTGGMGGMGGGHRGGSHGR